MNDQQKLKIREEFEEKFKSHPYGVFKDGAHYNPEFLPLTIENVEDFFLSKIDELLKSQEHKLREELTEKIEKMKIKEGNPVDGYSIKEESKMPFNMAISRVLSLIKE